MAERPWASIMIALAGSMGCPSRLRTARFIICTAAGEFEAFPGLLPAVFSMVTFPSVPTC
jgi:hypothetical protein